MACSGNAVSNAGGNGRTSNASVPAPNAGNQDPAAKHSYPQISVDAFLRSCEKAGSGRDFCSCMLDQVQAKYSFEEFSVIESKIVAGSPPEEFVEFSGKARAACTK